MSTAAIVYINAVVNLSDFDKMRDARSRFLFEVRVSQDHLRENTSNEDTGWEREFNQHQNTELQRIQNLPLWSRIQREILFKREARILRLIRLHEDDDRGKRGNGLCNYYKQGLTRLTQLDRQKHFDKITMEVGQAS